MLTTPCTSGATARQTTPTRTPAIMDSAPSRTALHASPRHAGRWVSYAGTVGGISILIMQGTIVPGPRSSQGPGGEIFRRVRSTRSEADQHLAGVDAAEQSEERVDGVVHALHDGLLGAQLAVPHPLRRLRDPGRDEVHVVHDDEALEGEPLADRQGQVVRSRYRRGRVVLGDRAAQREPAV